MDRIKSAVLFISNQLATICCYDGFLYDFDFPKGEQFPQVAFQTLPGLKQNIRLRINR